jgi:phosphatidylglycerophosphate synthase
MWLWVVLVIIFLILVVKSLMGALEATSNRPVAFLGTVVDGLSMLAMTAGIFGLLIALVLGVLADRGPRLAGDQLMTMLVWSGGLILFAFLMLVIGSYVRRMGRRPVAIARGPRAAH